MTIMYDLYKYVSTIQCLITLYNVYSPSSCIHIMLLVCIAFYFCTLIFLKYCFVFFFLITNLIETLCYPNKR